MVAASQLPINTNASAMQMAQTIFGDGVSVVSASYTGDSRSSGIFTDGLDTSPGVAPSDTGVILSTGRAQDFTNSAGGWWWGPPNQANQDTNTSTNTSGPTNNSQFNAAAGTTTYDASWLDVDFIPTGNVMTMQFVFSSEEYPEYTTSQYQDFVGVWVNGVQVELAAGDGDIDPLNINAGVNPNLFLSNTNSEYNTEMDGFTVTLTLTMYVNPGQVNSIRIGVADVVDSNYDSNLLIAGNSVQTTLVAMEDMASVYPEGSVTIDVLANDLNHTGGVMTITHVNGIAVGAGDSVTLATGQVVTLNADGTLTFTGNGDVEEVSFTYGVESSTGASDTGMVNVSSIPCFVAGTLIDTPDGARAVQTLRPGDLVSTRDHGAQPLRWIGRRVVSARGAMAPIRIAAGTYGDHGAIMVSPMHRILLRDGLAELLFDAPEVLVAAKSLVNGTSVRPVEGGAVEYVHLLFDRHEILCANGLDSESLLIGAMTNTLFPDESLDEIVQLFPELDLATGRGYSPSARRILRPYEARLLTTRVAA
ncbi:Hint domain-containing protein [Salipiger sp.]|uniref:Hint domain-containing protein n=1 Tax=Salipiger sp. TaxID=2078585 RepID=UPI003A98131F